MRGKLKEQFDEQVSSSPEFALGYFDGSQQAKVWLYTAEDLVAMYSKYPKGGAINLWCDGDYGYIDGASLKRKRDAGEQSAYRKSKEEENESIFKNLNDKHSTKYDMPRLQ